MAEGVEFRRKVSDSIAALMGPFTEIFPCDGNSTSDVNEVIKTQTWSHHATSSCSIGADNDSMAILTRDSA
jgi:choline dehydrogenase